MAEKKYEFTGKTRKYRDSTLHQIRALKEITHIGTSRQATVKKGDLGGWIESEENLSHEGLCWVLPGGMVFENAIVKGNATVFKNGKVYGEADVSETAVVGEKCKVYGEAILTGWSRIYNGVTLHESIRVGGSSFLVGDLWMYW